MGLLGSFIAGCVVGWFLHYILSPTTRQTIEPPANRPLLEPVRSEPPKAPTVTIEKLAPLPKEQRTQVVPTDQPNEGGNAAESTPASSGSTSSVISGGAASGVTVVRVPTPERAPVEERPAAAAPQAVGKGDRLQTINGIGPVYETKLKEAGVRTFAELAQQTPARVIEIIEPKTWQNIDASAWIAQAKTLADS